MFLFLVLWMKRLASFDDVDPLGPDWHSTERRKLSNREVVHTVLFAIEAPRACTNPVIIMDNLR